MDFAADGFASKKSLKASLTTCWTWHDEAAPAMERDGWFVIQENAFLDCLERKAEPLCTLPEAFQTLKVNLAALRSADAGAGFIGIDTLGD